jgi:acylphosphatase
LADIRLRLLITGRVQGVGFRAFVAHEGRALGLAGYVRNLADGRVEAEFSGEAAAVEALRAACGQGPSHARVEHVESLAPGDAPLPGNFETRRNA